MFQISGKPRNTTYNTGKTRKTTAPEGKEEEEQPETNASHIVFFVLLLLLCLPKLFVIVIEVNVIFILIIRRGQNTVRENHASEKIIVEI
jgi:hypothetical protein